MCHHPVWNKLVVYNITIRHAETEDASAISIPPQQDFVHCQCLRISSRILCICTSCGGMFCHVTVQVYVSLSYYTFLLLRYYSMSFKALSLRNGLWLTFLKVFFDFGRFGIFIGDATNRSLVCINIHVLPYDGTIHIK